VTPIDLLVEQDWFPPRWYRPWCKKVWVINIVSHGTTQALKQHDICYMAREYMAAMYDQHPDDFTVRSVTWA